MARRLLALTILACAACETPAEIKGAACAPEIPSYDALYELSDGRRPVIHTVSADARAAHAPELLARVRRALDADPTPMRPAERVVLQNDLWGLWQRLTSDGGHEELRAAVAELIRTLALPREHIPGGGRIGITTAAARAIPPDEGWREVGTEMVVFAHERSFEMRRIFHVVLGRDARALTSQLIAIDDRGQAIASDVPGDLEILAPARGAPTGARLFELDRSALRCREPKDALEETDRVSTVPGLGASSYFLELDPPAPVASMPCAQCHDDGEVDSLPRADLPIEPRIEALLRLSTELARTMSP